MTTRAAVAAADGGKPHPMPTQRYDIGDLDGRVVERYTPAFDGEGQAVYLLHHVEAVTSGVDNGSI
jgi:hypothetical protein